MAEPRRLRFWYRREGPAAWLAHLDVMRTFERASLRAGLPLLWSQGFNPRPQLVFALPIGVGIECEADPVEIGLAEAVAGQELVGRLNATLPQGFAVVRAQAVAQEKASLMAAVQAAEYRFLAPGLEQGLALLASKQALLVRRQRRGKEQKIDIRPLLQAFSSPAADTLDLLAAAGSRANLRPGLLLQALVNEEILTAEAADDARIIRRRVVLNFSEGG